MIVFERLPLLLGCAAIAGFGWTWIHTAETNRPSKWLSGVLLGLMVVCVGSLPAVEIAWPARGLMAIGGALGLTAVGTRALQTLPAIMLLIVICGGTLCLMAGAGATAFLLIIPWGIGMWPLLRRFTRTDATDQRFQPAWASDQWLRIGCVAVLCFVFQGGLMHRNPAAVSPSRDSESKSGSRIIIESNSPFADHFTTITQRLWREQADLLVLLAALAWLMWVGARQPQVISAAFVDGRNHRPTDGSSGKDS